MMEGTREGRYQLHAHPHLVQTLRWREEGKEGRGKMSNISIRNDKYKLYHIVTPGV